MRKIPQQVVYTNSFSLFVQLLTFSRFREKAITNQMKTPIFLLSIVVMASLVGCMNPPPRSGDHLVGKLLLIPEESERLQALRDAGKTFRLIVIVPAANDFISNKVAISVLKMNGGSAPADLLIDILRKEKEPAVAVVGKDDALTVATINAAIRQLNGKPTTTTILFAGKPVSVKQLQELTEKAGVPFEGVDFP